METDVGTSRWLNDADGIKFSEIDAEKLVCKTESVREFVEAPNKLCVVATKGLGKTLLLKYKRYLAENQGMKCIPENKVLDTFEVPFSLISHSHLSFLAEKSNWLDMWKFAFMLSAIVHSALMQEDGEVLMALTDELEERNIHIHNIGMVARKIGQIARHIEKGTAIPRHLRDSFVPSVIVTEVLFSPENDVREIVPKSVPFLKPFYLGLRTNLAFFIDRVDQQMRDCSVEAWYGSQVGLLEAAFDLYRDKNDIKVFCSIRQEAYSRYKSEIFLMVEDNLTMLRYDEEDLRRILTHAITTYESDIQSREPGLAIAEFTGRKEIVNRHSRITEQVFSYINRHTFGRPRDHVLIGHNISRIRERAKHRMTGGMTEEQFIHVVNDTTALELEKSYLLEVGRFMARLPLDELVTLYGLIPRNIVSLAETKDICRTLNGLSKCQHDCTCCEATHHPFCDLANVGLVGLVNDDPSLGGRYQIFREPYQLQPEGENQLPVVDWYLLHPSFFDVIKRHNRTYFPVRGITVGKGYEWLEHYDWLMETQLLREMLERESGAGGALRSHLDDLTEAIIGEPQAIKQRGEKLNSIREAIMGVSTTGVGQAASFVANVVAITDKVTSWMKGM